MRQTITALGLLALVACGGGEEQPPAQPIDPWCPDGLIDLPPRGVACLSCLHPNARASAQAIIEKVLLPSCLARPVLTYLVDGTFGSDVGAIASDIAKLAVGGRCPVVDLHITNGPGQRRWRSKLFDGFGTNISPEEYRRRIQDDPEFREQYQLLAARLLPLIEDFPDVQWRIVPMLEDNLSDDAFIAQYGLTVAALPVGVAIGRNPCTSCYDGNEGWIPPFVYEERHIDHPHYSFRYGTVTNDGDPVSGDYCSLQPMCNRATTLYDPTEPGTYVACVLWCAECQGIEPGRDLRDPDERTYEIPTEEEATAMRLTLRGECANESN